MNKVGLVISYIFIVVMMCVFVIKLQFEIKQTEAKKNKIFAEKYGKQKCRCGNDLLQISPYRFFCPVCGQRATKDVHTQTLSFDKEDNTDEAR